MKTAEFEIEDLCEIISLVRKIEYQTAYGNISVSESSLWIWELQNVIRSGDLLTVKKVKSVIQTKYIDLFHKKPVD